MAHQKWKTVVKDGGAVPTRKRYKSIKPRRVCRNHEGETGGEEVWQTVRRAAKTHSAEGRAI